MVEAAVDDMRGLRSFLGLVVILIALGAYLYFVESKRDPFESAEKREKVFAVESDKIEEITIRSEKGEQTTVRKAGDRWQIVSPASADADASEISSVATSLSTLEEQRLIEENPTDLEAFGLAKPRIEVAFKADGQDHQLLLGNKTPTGADLYAKTSAQPKVFLIASYLESTFNRDTFALRDKSALKFDRDNVERLELTSGGKTLRFAKSNGEWQIVEPAGHRPDSAAIEGLIARLNSLQMKAIESGEAAAPGKYGLDKPGATVRIGSGSSEATLLVGASAAENTVYARDTARPEVFTIESSMLDDLKKDVSEYRQKDIFDARAFNTTRVEIARGSDTFVFERRDDKWHQTGPTDKEAEAGKVDTLLSALTSARADGFAEALPAGAKTEATVTLKFDGGNKEERVTLSRAGSDAYAVRAGTSGAAKITTNTLDGILKALEEAR